MPPKISLKEGPILQKLQTILKISHLKKNKTKQKQKQKQETKHKNKNKRNLEMGLEFWKFQNKQSNQLFF